LAVVPSVVALIACSDQEPTTAPARGLTPRFGVGDVITVTNTSGGTGFGSFRWALSLVTGGEIIRFDPSLAGGTIVLDSTAVLRRGATIEGPADKGVTISGARQRRVLDLTAVDPVVVRNLTIRDGAALIGAGILGNNVRLEHVTLTNNHATLSSAAVAGTLVLVNSTVSGNTSDSLKYTVASHSYMGSVALINSTIAFNIGRGFFADRRTLESSVLVHNSKNNCEAPFGMTYVGTSFADDTTCGDINTVLIGDAKLDSLRDNGGPTPTHAFDPSSPLLNAGQNCSVTVDQRYAPRDSQCDIGAFEFLDYAQVSVTINGTTSLSQATGSAVVTGTITCSRPGPFAFGLTVALKQSQRAGRGSTTVEGTGSTPVECTNDARTWSAVVRAASGAFDIGGADASVQTANTPAWVIPAQASGPAKLFWARR
jgi:hypothetical protein